MHIVHVANSTLTGQLGTEKIVLHLAADQKAAGLNVSVLVDRKEGLAEACRELHIPVTIAEELGMVEPRGVLRASPRAERAMQSLHAKFDDLAPDLLHIHTPPAAAKVIPAANLRQTPCLFTVLANKPQNPGMLSARHPMAEWRMQGMRFAVICVSTRDLEDLKRSGFPESDLHYVPLGTRTVTPAPHREAHHLNRQNLIFAGSLTARKRPDLAILTMVELRRRNSPLCPVLSIYGDGEERGYLSEIVKVLELGEVVRLFGYKPNVLEQCLDTDILIVTSERETGPLTVLEAMSRGMPIVSTDVGDVPSMIPDQRYGRVVPPNSITALADAVQSIISDIDSKKFDKSLLIERHRSLFTREKVTQRTEEVYGRVIAQFRASAPTSAQ